MQSYQEQIINYPKLINSDMLFLHSQSYERIFVSGKNTKYFF